MDRADGERRLAAILSADVAGYSRLMGDDEAATVRVHCSVLSFVFVAML